MDHRAYLYRVRTAVQRCDHAGLRGHPHPPFGLAVLERGGQAPGQHLLYRTHRHSRADARGRRSRQGGVAQEPEAARHRRRAHQSGSLGMVLPGRGRRPMPRGGHLVANGNRWNSDHPPARRHAAQAGLRHPAVLRRRAGAGRQRRTRARGRGHRQPGDHPALARPDAHRLRRSSALHRHLLQDLPGQVLHRRRRATG